MCCLISVSPQISLKPSTSHLGETFALLEHWGWQFLQNKVRLRSKIRLTYFRGFHPASECLPWNIKRSASLAVVCYPLERFFTNRLYHLLGNLPRCHLTSSTPVFTVLQCVLTEQTGTSLPFSCVWWGEEKEPWVFFFCLFNNCHFFSPPSVQNRDSKYLNRSFKKHFFSLFLNLLFFFFFFFRRTRGKGNIKLILCHLKPCQYTQACFWFNAVQFRAYFSPKLVLPLYPTSSI